MKKMYTRAPENRDEGPGPRTGYRTFQILLSNPTNNENVEIDETTKSFFLCSRFTHIHIS